LFHAGFFDWIGKGVVQHRLERPPLEAPQAPGIPVTPNVSLQPEVLKNDGWQEIVHSIVSQHRGWSNSSLPAPLPINLIVRTAPVHLPVQSSHASKSLKTEAHHDLEKRKSHYCPFLTLQWL
jgi:hypothetical protein